MNQDVLKTVRFVVPPLAAFVFVLLVLWPVIRPLSGWCPPLWWVKGRYAPIIHDLKSGKLVIGTRPPRRYYGWSPSHAVDLPERYRSVAQLVFADRKSDGRLFVLFVDSQTHDGLSGYVYCSRSLTPEDFQDSVWGPTIDACGIRNLHANRINSNWCCVCIR